MDNSKLQARSKIFWVAQFFLGYMCYSAIYIYTLDLGSYKNLPTPQPYNETDTITEDTEFLRNSNLQLDSWGANAKGVCKVSWGYMRCGPKYKGLYCPHNYCCSRWAWCGLSKLHCQNPRLSSYDGTRCNACRYKNGLCHKNALCYYKSGKRHCACKAGYTGDGIKTCDRINPCTKNNGGCHSLAHCTPIYTTKTPTVACKCNKYYAGDGKKNCSDIDECKINNGGCSPNAICHNNIGKPNDCKCKEYFEGDGKTCTDINECNNNNGGCSPLALCVNVIGGPNKCVCSGKK